MMDRRIYNHKISLQQLIALRAYAQAIDVTALKKTNALYAGLHSSPMYGRGMDFAEVRTYQTGDDIRNMDWRVTARRGKAHTKLYCEERERPIYFVIDLAASMEFGSEVTFKSGIAQQTTAILAWAASIAGNSVGATIIKENQILELKPRLGTTAVLSLLNKLLQISSSSLDKSYDLVSQIKYVQRRLKPGALVFVLSDFYCFSEELKSYLIQLNRRQNCILGFIYDRLEELLPSFGLYTITSGHEIFQFNSGDKNFYQKYLRNFQKKHEQIKSFCGKQGIGLFSLTTAADVVKQLTKIFRRC